MSKKPFESVSKLKKTGNGAIYDVEYIYGKRLENGVTKYLVKWEGYPTSESSFEPIDNLENVQHFIRGFERKMSELIFKVALLTNARKGLPPVDGRINNVQNNRVLPQSVPNQPLPQKQSSLGLKLSYLSELEEAETKKPITKSNPIQFRDPVLDNELNEKEMGIRAINNEKMKYGNFNNGDIPQCIVKHAPYTRIQKALGKNHTLLLPSSIYFKVEFKPRPSGTVPLSAYISFEEIKDKYPRELLNYYYQNAVLLDPVPQQQQAQDQPAKP